jgi:hypothetical protein
LYNNAQSSDFRQVIGGFAMKKLLTMGALLALGTVSSFALPTCSTGLVSDLIASGGCTAPGGVGFDFVNFSLMFDPTVQAAYYGTPILATSDGALGGTNTQYTYVAGSGLTGFGLTFSPLASGTNSFPGGVWKVTTNTEAANSFSNLNFKINYFITDTVAAQNRINQANTTQTGLTAPVGADYSTTQSVLNKFVTDAGFLATGTNNINAAGTNQTKTVTNNFTPSTATQIRIVDNVALTLSDTATAQMSLASITNTFSVQSTPEPVSLALMGSGLIGIALLRRRVRKS